MPTQETIKAVEKYCPKCGVMLIPLQGDYKSSCPTCTQERTCGIKEIWYCPSCYYIEVKAKNE